MLLIALFFMLLTAGQAQDQVAKTWNWDFAGKQFSITTVINLTVYNSYQSAVVSQTTKDRLTIESPNENFWRQEYFGEPTRLSPDDLSVATLGYEFKKIAKKNNFNNRQLADLIISFVRQCIEVDNQKLELRLKNGCQTAETKAFYPCETLYQSRGLCQDKSILLYCLLRQVNFGVCLFFLQSNCNEKYWHMGCGIYNGHYGYLYIETMVDLAPVGQIPTFDPKNYAIWMTAIGCPAKVTPMMQDIGNGY